MTATLTTELQGAQRTAATAQVLAVLALIVIGINIAFRVGYPVAMSLFDDATPWRDHIHEIGLLLVSLLPAFLFFEAVNQLRHALKRYAAGDFFSAAAASRVAKSGDYAISAVIAIMFVVPNLLLWISKRGGFDMRIESELIGMLAFALFVAVVGRILSAAVELKSENDSFV